MRKSQKQKERERALLNQAANGWLTQIVNPNNEIALGFEELYGGAFNRAWVSSFLAYNADMQAAFKEVIERPARVLLTDSDTSSTRPNRPIPLNFQGYSGWRTMLAFAGFSDTPVWEKLIIVRHYLNPYNYALWLAVFFDELEQGLVRQYAPMFANPSMPLMMVHGFCSLITGLNRYAVSAACAPFYFIRQNPKFLALSTMISLLVCNLVTYLNTQKDPDSNQVYQAYHDAASTIFAGIFAKMLGTLSDHSKAQCIQIIMAMLVQHTAITMGVMIGRLPQNIQTLLREIQAFQAGGTTSSTASPVVSMAMIPPSPRPQDQLVVADDANGYKCVIS